MQIEEFLEQSADRTPDKTALVCDGQRLTYAGIEARSNQLAHVLLAKGLQRWDRVAVYAPNSVDTVLSIFGILKAGGVFVLINPTTKRDKLAYVLNNCRATALVTTRRLSGTALSAAAETPGR